MKEWVDKEVERLTKKGKKMSKREFLRLIFIVAYSRGKEEFKEEVFKKIDELLIGQHSCGFIDSSDNLCDRIPREKIEELKKQLEKVK